MRRSEKNTRPPAAAGVMRLGKTKLAVATGGNVQQSKHRASVYSSRNMHFCTCPAA